MRVKIEGKTSSDADARNASSSTSNSNNVSVKTEIENAEASSSSSTVGARGANVKIDIAATDKASNLNTTSTAPIAATHKRKGKHSYPATKQGDVENGLKLWKKQCTVSILDKDVQEVLANICAFVRVLYAPQIIQF